MFRVSCFAVCLLGLVLVSPAAAGDVVSVINTGETTVFVDSVKFFVFPQERIVPTPGFGGESGAEDTFRFDSRTEWPESGLELYYIMDGMQRDPWYLPDVREHDWYNFPGYDDPRFDPPKIKFYNASGVSEGGPGEVARHGLTASPNPFTSRTLLRCALSGPDRASVDVFDASGRFVRALASGSADNTFAWDGRDASGARARPGVYLARLTCGSGNGFARLVLLD